MENLSKVKSSFRHSKNLKEAYQRRIAAESLDRPHNVMVLGESFKVILEKLDKGNLETSKKIIEKLNAILTVAEEVEASRALAPATKAAISSVNKVLGGQFTLGDLRSAFKDNVFLKAVTYVACLEDGFGSMNDLIKNNFSKYDQNSDETIYKQMRDAGEDEAFKTLYKITKKSFMPDDLSSILPSWLGGGVPFVKDMQEFVGELLGNISAKSLTRIISVASKSEIPSEFVQQVAAGTESKADGGKSKEQATAGRSVAPIDDTAGLAAAIAALQAQKKGSTSEETKEKVEDAKKNSKEFASSFIAAIARKTELKPKRIQKILKILLKAKKFKSPFNESRAYPTTLTLKDVRTARTLYLESGCSARRWMRLLVEQDTNTADRNAAQVFDALSSFLDSFEQITVANSELKKLYTASAEQTQKLKDDFDRVAEEVEKRSGVAEKKKLLDVLNPIGEKIKKSESLAKSSNYKEALEKMLEASSEMAKLFVDARAIIAKLDAEQLKTLNNSWDQSKNQINDLKSSAEKAAEEIKILTDRVTKSEESENQFVRSLAAALKKSEDEVTAAIKKEGGLEEFIKSALSNPKAEPAVTSAAESSVEAKAESSKESSSGGDPRKTKLADQLYDDYVMDLGKASPADIIKVLDAIPAELLKLESFRKQNLLERVNQRPRVLT